MSSEYKIQISMPNDTVQALQDGKFYLFGFKAVQTTQGGGAPLIWFKIEAEKISLTTEIDWDEQYQAYVSRSSIISGGHIDAKNSVDIDLGQEWDVSGTGAGPIIDSEMKQAISIKNMADKQWTTGICQVVENKPNSLCAFPLYGNNLDVIAPIEKVLLMFATDTVNTGTVIYKAYSQGIMIDLTSDNFRSVSYDINKSWEWGGFSWAHIIQANANLVPLLIESPAFTSGDEKLGRMRKTRVQPITDAIGSMAHNY